MRDSDGRGYCTAPIGIGLAVNIKFGVKGGVNAVGAWVGVFYRMSVRRKYLNGFYKSVLEFRVILVL